MHLQVLAVEVLLEDEPGDSASSVGKQGAAALSVISDIVAVSAIVLESLV